MFLERNPFDSIAFFSQCSLQSTFLILILIIIICIIKYRFLYFRSVESFMNGWRFDGEVGWRIGSEPGRFGGMEDQLQDRNLESCALWLAYPKCHPPPGFPKTTWTSHNFQQVK